MRSPIPSTIQAAVDKMESAVFAVPSLFCADGDNASTQNGGSTIPIRCPQCKTLGQFGVIGQSYRYTKRVENENVAYTFEAGMRLCPNPGCKGVLFAITRPHPVHGEEVMVVLPPELIEFDTSDLPAKCVKTLEEAAACHAAGAYRAAAMMVRRLLEEVCDDQGATGRTLHDRIKQLKNQVTLPSHLIDGMDNLKLLGNDAAHVELKNFDQVDKQEAELAIKIVQEIVKALYQHKTLMAQLEQLKSGAAQP